ncbi:DUF6443 domain-containing protein [Dawidia soli]|uniref:Fibronectin type III domain-containing protein n=1 Tax=Dawidia soli TaxID=2782352 RepID=A0AAP2GGR8_9BACT|nr:DUF6443 domain-containing protein [Dawidia soli]MBT1685805.1 fibronectin type III domain-containing protein [Dawidia soli]
MSIFKFCRCAGVLNKKNAFMTKCCFLRVRTLVMVLVFFLTWASATAQITVTSPAGGESIVVGASFTVRYSSSVSISYVVAEIYKGAQKITTLTSIYPNTNYSVSTAGYSPGTDYRVKVFDYASPSVVAWSNYFSVVALAPPTAYSAINVYSNSFTAKWSAVAGATGYVIDVSTVSNFSSFVYIYNNLSTSTLTGSATSAAITNSIYPATYYYYRLRAINSSGQSTNSNIITVLTLPLAPVLNAASSVSSNSFVINWAPVSGVVSGYRVDVSTNSDFSSFVAGYNNISTSGTSLSLSGLSPNTIYYYRVRAENGSGNSANSAIGSKSTTLVAPVANAATSVTESSFMANWSLVSGASDYVIDISTLSDFSSFHYYYNNLSTTALTGGGAIVAIYGSIASATYYYYRFRAVNGAGQSANSNIVTVLTLPQAPVALPVTNVTTTSFTANWSPVSGVVTGYEVDVSSSSTFSTLIPGFSDLPATGTSLTITGLPGNTIYYYRVRARNGSGSSANSVGRPALCSTQWLITPNGGEVYQPGAAIPIIYNTALYSVYGIAVELYMGNQKVFPTGSTPYFGSIQSIIPDPLPFGDNYRIHIYDIDNPGVEDWSDEPFEIGNGINYVRTETVLVRDIKTKTAITALEVGQKYTNTDYFDGLGRLVQKVAWKASPSHKDIVQPVAYDGFGREQFKYEPFTMGSNGWYKDVAGIINASGNYIGDAQAFYAPGSDNDVVDNTNPFSEARLEASPLNRVIKQGAPGVPWQPNNTDSYSSTDHTIKYSHEFNAAGEVLEWRYTPPTSANPLGLVNATSTATPTQPNYFGVAQLWKDKIKDENGFESIVYSNKDRQVVLRRKQLIAGATVINDTNYASTYYIYDAFDNLVAVIQPEGVARLATEYYQSGATDATKESFLQKWAFRYSYDARRRMTKKQVPGALPAYLVYDNRDRVVLTQDGNLRLDGVTNLNKWLFSKYDAFNRVVLTGIYTADLTLDQAGMQGRVDAFYNNLTANQADWFETYIGNGSGNVLGYNNKSFPRVTDTAPYLTANYYDSYDSFNAPAEYSYATQGLPGQEAANALVNGQQVANLVKNLTSQSWLRTVSYYDSKYRLIQTVSDHIKGTVRSGTVYDFVGNVLYSKRDYAVNAATVSVKETFTYDHSGRLLTHKHSYDNANDVTIVKNRYNELGQLVDKQLHSTNDTDFKQSIDYAYNSRGWLTRINGSDITTQQPGDATLDYFGMDLNYDDVASGFSSTASFNGNISSIRWMKGVGTGNTREAYSFSYDPMSRFTNADHFDFSNDLWISNNNAFGEAITEYDRNGNIKKLKRKSFGGVLIDDLVYGYVGNLLSYVNDTQDPLKGFINGNTGTDDYSYDLNGNLDKDKNKGLLTKGSIRYNHLNLPSQVLKGTDQISYVYDATGAKLSQVVSGATSKTTDYIGELIYENNSLLFVNHTEGRVIPAGSEYQYYLKDHLGNVQLTFTTKPQSTTTYSTNFETPTSPDFQNYTTNTFDLVDHTDAGTTYTKTQLLNGGQYGRVGLGKSFSVMPGDQISASASAKYMNLSTSSNTNSLIISLASAFGVSPSSTGEQLKLYNGLNSYAGIVPGGDHNADDEDAPKAFITIVFFDRNYNFVDAAWDQVSTVGEQTSPTVKQPHDLVTVTARAPVGGFAYIFLSNEHPTFVNVYFDDASVSYTPSEIISADDYYPFGSTFNSYNRENSIRQNYKFNGIEEQNDLNLEVYSAFYRMYDPVVGRWWQVDPKPSFQESPYLGMDGNPILRPDPLGDKVRYERGDGVTREQHREFKREIRQMRKNSDSFGKMHKDLRKDRATFVYKSESNNVSTSGAYGNTEQKDGKTYMRVNVNSDAEGSQSATQISGIAHETGHGWRQQQGLELPEPTITGADRASMNSYIDAFAQTHETNERGASHIENIVKSELMRSGNAAYGGISLRSEYSPGFKSVMKFDVNGQMQKTLRVTTYDVLELPRDANYYNQKIDIHQEHGVHPIE